MIKYTYSIQLPQYGTNEATRFFFFVLVNSKSQIQIEFTRLFLPSNAISAHKHHFIFKKIQCFSLFYFFFLHLMQSGNRQINYLNVFSTVFFQFFVIIIIAKIRDIVVETMMQHSYSQMLRLMLLQRRLLFCAAQYSCFTKLVR